MTVKPFCSTWFTLVSSTFTTSLTPPFSSPFSPLSSTTTTLLSSSSSSGIPSSSLTTLKTSSSEFRRYPLITSGLFTLSKGLKKSHPKSLCGDGTEGGMCM
ncbi:hypothetical protein TorRG33x02_142280 [Trema orientale]|uniref:Uncharacterized protein n=1 Tax=Trema orientale TaxID=63057 RepID=A0A2P5EWM9_TREOI|nr:hypothetical protein TorRG33x02_142280 [Trema orientale]